MKLYIKYDIATVCKSLLQEQLNKFGIKYTLNGIGEVDILEPISAQLQKEFLASINAYGIDIVENQKSVLVQKTKDVITELVYTDDRLPLEKISSYLADKLQHSYGYIANLFSEVTYTSIENYIILQKIERAKQLIINNELTLTQISYKLNYSSVAHLSNQFKKTTGLTPSAFQRIIEKRRSLASGS